MNLFLMAIPIYLETTTQPSQLLQQWRSTFLRGHTKGPALSIATGTLYAVAAWYRHVAGNAYWRVFAVAGATTVSMIPYTWIVMMSTNNALFSAVDASKEGQGAINWAEAETLVVRWSRLNAVRALFPFSGAVIGMLGISGILAF